MCPAFVHTSECCHRYEDKYVDSLSERLDDIVTMRNTQAELAELLPSSDHSIQAVSVLQIQLLSCYIC